MGWPMGRDPGQQKGRSLETGPDLHFLWWRGQDLSLRPSGYETTTPDPACVFG